MIEHMEKDCIFIRMDHIMRATGLMIDNMDMEGRNGYNLLRLFKNVNEMILREFKNIYLSKYNRLSIFKAASIK